MSRQRAADEWRQGAAVSFADHLELLADMSRDFAETRDIDASLQCAVERITRHLNAAGGALFLLDESGTALTCRACWGATNITGIDLKADEGIVGRCVQSNAGEIVRDAAEDPAFYRAVDRRTGFTTKSILCAPMSVKDQRLGAIELVNKIGGDGKFTTEDLNVLQALSSSAALAILNARQAEALVEQGRVRRELELAAEIQRGLLPKQRPSPYPVQGLNIPAHTVSGDFYDIFALDDGRIYFNLADVSGKGMNAALLMAKTLSVFRCLGKAVHRPGRLLALVNGELCETITRGMFVTMVGGLYDPRTGAVRFANAGHEPPLYRDRTGRFTAYPADSPPLGILPPASPDEALPETELNLAGGTLYVFSDGVTEGYLDDGREFGVEGLKALIQENADISLDRRLEALIAPIHRSHVVLRDDITILAVEDAADRQEKRKGRARGR